MLSHSKNNDFPHRPLIPSLLPQLLIAFIAAIVTSIAIFLLTEGQKEEERLIISIIAGLSVLLIVLGTKLLAKKQSRLSNQKVHTVRKHEPIGFKAVSPTKLTIEANAKLLSDLKQKSEAASVFSQVSASHLEVCKMCDEYIARAEAELETIRPGSPRLGQLRKGIEYSKKLHRYHTLKWAEIETRSITEAVGNAKTINEKLKISRNAGKVIDTALAAYPEEILLIESAKAIEDLTVSLELKSAFEKARRAEKSGSADKANKLYAQMLERLTKNSNKSGELSDLENQIKQKLKLLESADGEGKH